MPNPLREVIIVFSFISCHKPSTFVGSFPIRISLNPLPIACVPGESIVAFVAQGFVSVSPNPNKPSSVEILTTRLS